MLIGELATQTGTSERLLRYYERAGLLRAERLPNGYRSYSPSATKDVRRIRALLAAGLPTRVIRQVLPCTSDMATVQPCPGVLHALREQLRHLDRRATELAAARQLLRETIAAAEAQETSAPADKRPPGAGTESRRTNRGAARGHAGPGRHP